MKKRIMAWVSRVVETAVWDTRYKKAWLEVKQCPKYGIFHDPHPWAESSKGYLPKESRPYFCEGVK